MNLDIKLVVMAIAFVAILALWVRRSVKGGQDIKSEPPMGEVQPGMPTHDGPYRDVACLVCGAPCQSLAYLDFNKTCADGLEPVFSSAGIPVEYQQCRACGFIFAPMFVPWSMRDFQTWIYNRDYPLTDPEYLLIRPHNSANWVEAIFGEKKGSVRHLDYGGGNGAMSRRMSELGWNSTSYDPFDNPDVEVGSLGRFDLITTFEVIEHVPDPQQFMALITPLLTDDGVILISTVLSDNEFPAGGLNWWYASPRNGHISLFSLKSIGALARQHGFQHRSFSGVQVLNRKIPAWAPEMFPS